MFKIKKYNNAIYQTLLLILLIASIYFVAKLEIFNMFFSYIFKIFGPVIYGFVMAFILNLPMKKIENILKKFVSNKFICRGLSLILTLFILGFVLVWFSLLVIPELTKSISSLIKQVPSMTQLEDAINSVFKYLHLSEQTIAKVSAYISKALSNFLTFISSTVYTLTSYIGAFASFMVTFVLSLIISIYMLISKENLLLSIKRFSFAFINTKFVKKCLKIIDLLDESFSSFIQSQLTEAVILSAICYIGMLVLKMPYSVLISVIVGFTNIIPMFGAYIGGTVAIILLAITDTTVAFYFFIFLVIIQQIESNLIYPRVVGNSLGLSGFWVMVCVVVGNNLFGVFGVLIGLPLFSTFSKILKIKTDKKIIKKNIIFKDETVLDEVVDNKLNREENKENAME